MLAHERLGERLDADDREVALAARCSQYARPATALDGRFAAESSVERADDQQLVLLRLADEEREELGGRRIGPLQVFDDEDQRRAAGLVRRR